MAVPIDIADLLRTTKRIRAEREKPLHVMMALDPNATDELIDALAHQSVPNTPDAIVQTEVVEQGVSIALADSVDALIAVTGPDSASLSNVLKQARGRAIPALALGIGDDPATLALATGHAFADCRVAPDPDAALAEAARWLVERVPGKRLALAHNFDFARRAVAEEAVRATAVQNGLIGAAVIIPGADMPLITVNQGKMLLQIAAAYGQPLGVERVKELSVVVGGGFALRAAARQIAGAVPGLGWAVKGAVGYGGTVAMGKAAIAHFEQGASLAQVAHQLAGITDAAVQRIRESRCARASASGRLADASEAAETDDRSAH
ncbi:MAG TPA: hypothetical protein VFH17_08665 [Coriobacteriia bacterium]|nr:hypothetical protein [Coriobacteriia bacterium]